MVMLFYSGNNGYVATGDNSYALLSFATGDNSYTLSPAATDDNDYALSWSGDEIIDGVVLLLLVIIVIWFLIIITGNGYAFLFATSDNIGYVATGNNGYALLSFATGDNGYTLPSDATGDNGYALS